MINESRHLLVFGVPKINLKNEIKRKLNNFGDISILELITDEMSSKGLNIFIYFVEKIQFLTSPTFLFQISVELEAFTDCYHVSFVKLEHARRCKKFLDARNFYGGILHISYAPEKETVDDVRLKLKQRISEVKFRIKVNKKRLLKRQQSDEMENDKDNKRLKLN